MKRMSTAMKRIDRLRMDERTRGQLDVRLRSVNGQIAQIQQDLSNMGREVKAKMIRLWLADLPAADRRMLLMHQADRLSARQIADVMGMDVRAVRTRIYELKVQLQEYLAN